MYILSEIRMNIYAYFFNCWKNNNLPKAAAADCHLMLLTLLRSLKFKGFYIGKFGI
jgi:hypothetical protein